MRYVLYLHLVPIISLSTGCCSPSPQYPNLADAGVRQASISKYNTILFPSRPRRTGYQVYPTNGCPDRPLLVLFRLVIHVNVTLKPHSPPYLIDANEMLPITSNQNCGQEPSQDRWRLQESFTGEYVGQYLSYGLQESVLIHPLFRTTTTTMWRRLECPESNWWHFQLCLWKGLKFQGRYIQGRYRYAIVSSIVLRNPFNPHLFTPEQLDGLCQLLSCQDMLISTSLGTSTSHNTRTSNNIYNGDDCGC